ncbi:MAG: 16S rRNA (guanine(527)-N(7))-methyltransferase RsmG [Thermoclostridium sp.]|nr:16S rRNA (guanine(527)-N(7))-methyltransferase RsmG [Thermoclostridium sp.]
MTRENAELLKSGASCFGVHMNEQQVYAFSRYHEQLIDWNERINLTAITEERDVVIKHFIDSVSILRYLPEGTETVIDVGTGAGFPGIPMKIVQSSLKVTLLDSLEKRVRFLETVIMENQLSGMQAIHGRAEDFAREKSHRECYDVGVARAVASLPVLCEYILPFVRIGGVFIAMKGSEVQNELEQSGKAISILGGTVKKVEHFTLPFDPMERHIILIEKIRQTPTQYPRKSGKPTKSPLR